MRGRKSAQAKLQNIRNAAAQKKNKQKQKEAQRKVRDDDGGWEDLVESTRVAGATLPAAIKTFRVSGLVALPSAVKAALVAACVFYAFSSALLFCIVALAGIAMLAMSLLSSGRSATATIDCEEEMLECITLAHLERRFRHRTLRLDDCIHYVLFKIMRLVEAINTLRRSMLDYSFTVSIAPSSASHDLLELVDAADKIKQQQQQQQSKAASTHQKKKKQKKSRVKTIYSGQITVEEYTYMPEIRAVEVKKEEIKLMATAVLAPVEIAPVLKKVDTVVSSKQVVHDLKEDTTVVLEQLKIEELLPKLLVPKIRAPAQPKVQAECESQAPKQTTVHSASKAVEKKKKKNSKPALRIETVEKSKDDAQTAMQLPQAKKQQPLPVVISPVAEKKVVPEATQQQQQEVDEVVRVVPIPVPAPVLEADVIVPSPAGEETVEKQKRRRSSRTRRSRTRRSTLSITERPSSFYEEFLLLEPLIVKPLTPKYADKNQELYTTEAQKVRSLQQTQLPLETKPISNPEIRIMVDEMNNMVSGMHAALAKNWEFLASLLEETARIEEKEEEMKKKQQLEWATARREKLSVECIKDVRPASEVEDELFLQIEEPEFEDECFGDLEDDDHYYASRPMSAPCLSSFACSGTTAPANGAPAATLNQLGQQPIQAVSMDGDLPATGGDQLGDPQRGGEEEEE